MHQIQVKVKLINALDEMLINRQMLNPNQLRVYETEGFVDTDFVRTNIPMSVIEQLGLEIRCQEIAKYLDGTEEIINLSEAVTIEIQGRKTIESVIVSGDEILIGRNALAILDLIVDNENQCLIPKHPNCPVFKI